jgi:hypothetical protein
MPAKLTEKEKKEKRVLLQIVKTITPRDERRRMKKAKKQYIRGIEPEYIRNAKEEKLNTELKKYGMTPVKKR